MNNKIAYWTLGLLNNSLVRMRSRLTSEDADPEDLKQKIN
jgi:hypothetical protein